MRRWRRSRRCPPTSVCRIVDQTRRRTLQQARHRPARRSPRRPPPCLNARSSRTAPAPSRTQASCVRDPHSTPTNHLGWVISVIDRLLAVVVRFPGNATVPAGLCTGARSANSSLGIHRGRTAGAPVPRRCSRHEGTGGRSRRDSAPGGAKPSEILQGTCLSPPVVQVSRQPAYGRQSIVRPHLKAEVLTCDLATVEPAVFEIP